MRQAIQRAVGGHITVRIAGCTSLENATYSVYDPSDTLLDGPHSIDDPYADTVSAAAASGDLTALSVTSPPSELRGRRLRCVPATGGSLDLRVEGVDTAAVLVRLPRYGATIASVLLPELTAEIPAASVPSNGRGYRVRFTFDADEIPTTRDMRFDVLEAVVPGISWAELLDRDPSMRMYLATSGDIDYESLIELARETVDLEMGKYGDRSACIAEHDDLVPLLVRAVTVKAAEMGFIPPAHKASPLQYLDYIRRQFASECKSVLQTAYRQTDAGVMTAAKGTMRSLYIRRA
jgi:hypothetical protein